jgi:hypothetical protein
MLKTLIKSMMICLTIVRWLLIIVLLLTILGFIIPYLSGVDQYPYLLKIASYESIINQKIMNTIPTKMGRFELSRIITVIAILLLFDIIRTLNDKLKLYEHRNRMRKELLKNQQTNQSRMDKDKID